MDILATGGLTFAIIIGAAVLFGALLVIFLVMRAFTKVAKADEALVISGKSQKIAGTDEESKVTVIVNGRALINPITQRYETISLRSRQVSMDAEAQSLDGVTLNVNAVAIVKIGSEPNFVRRAAERFASQDKAIEVFTTEQLEGALRGVVAKLTVVELMRERKSFSDQIAVDVSTELAEQGLLLDSFQIKGITDKVGYIASLGQPEIEAKRQAAEIAQTNAERAIRKQQITNEEANLVEQTAFDANTAESKSKIGKANAEAEQAEALARAQAEQSVLQQNAENRQAQLDADVKRVADADLYKSQKTADAEAYRLTKAAEAQREIAASEAEATRLRAAADAEAVRLAGQARADAIKAEAEALAENQQALLAQRALDILPAVMGEWSKGYSAIGGVTIVGGSGTSGAEQVGDESSVSLRRTFESIKATTGLDLTELIQGRATGEAIGRGISGAGVADTIEAASDAVVEKVATATESAKKAVVDLSE